MDLYFECKSGISGDMAVASLLDLGASEEKLAKALNSLSLENEFSYAIKKVAINAIMATDFDVVLPQHHHAHEHEHHGHKHHHEHRNLDDVSQIIDKAHTTDRAKALAKKIFAIVAEAEAHVHGKSLAEVHFHEVGAIDSIADIVSFAVLFDDLNPENVYFSTLHDGTGFVQCQHGTLPVPVPAVCEIIKAHKIPFKITANDGEMVTPTGAAIVAALYDGKKLEQDFTLAKIGYGAGKRKYDNPLLRAMLITHK